ncbi:MAG: hypothetical protein IPM57_08885 [Oligoflexia bacterium]|nr:hypothetical protein [Oligoflexia bacterium]
MTSQVTTAQLAKRITQNITHDNAGRVALFHFIKNTCRGDEEVTTQFINDFFAECLLLPSWQEKRVELYKDIKELLYQFQINLDQLWDLQKMQLVMLQSAQNLYSAVKFHEAKLNKESTTFRVIPDGEHRMVVLRKNPDGNFIVRTYGNTAYIQGKDVVPVKYDQELVYGPTLELCMGVTQSIRLSAHTQIRFEISENSIIAQTLSGFAFRQSQIVELKYLSDFTPLFFHLKKLEKFYVYRASDPFYMELIQNIDRALQGSGPASRKTLEEAQIIFDQVFPDDKVLYMKLKELAKLVALSPRDLQG